MQVGQTVLLHQKNNPMAVVKQLWCDCDMKRVDVQDVWMSLKIIGKTGIIKAIYGKEVYVDFGQLGIWCLHEKMLEIIE